MDTLYFILYLLAGICFLIALITHARPVAGEAGTTAARIHWLALGLLFWVLVPIIVTARALD